MNILFVGDTSNYHSGCKVVVELIKSQLQEHSLISLPPMHNYPKVAWETVDWLLCNGEGTMHNNRPAAIGTLLLIKQAQEHNVKTAIINSVWQNMDDSWIKVIKKLQYFSVREQLSAEHARKVHGRMPYILPDLSYFFPVKIIPNNTHEVVGKFFEILTPDWGPVKIDIFNQDWNEIINILASAPYLYTGRHHELYASCVAKTPFIPHKTNSHKLEGLFYSSKTTLPILKNPLSQAECRDYVKKYNKEYKKVFDWLDSFPVPSINKILAQS